MYVRVCSKNATGVDDNNCVTSDATTIKTDFTAPEKKDKGKYTKGEWYYWWFKYKDTLSGLTSVNTKKGGSKLYYCYNACSRDCKKKKHDENTWKGPDGIWYRQAEVQNNLERGNDSLDKLTMKTSKGCGKYVVHVYLQACDVAGNCSGYDDYKFSFK